MPTPSGDRLAVHYSSANDSWETPQPLFDALDAELGPFTLDAAASDTNRKVPDNYFTVEDDGLAQPWSGRVWLNCPYGRGVIDQWIDKAIAEADHCDLIALLIPNRPGSRWYERTLHRADEMRFLTSRVTFVGAPSRAPFPTAVAIFLPRAASGADNVLPLSARRRPGLDWTTVRTVRDAS